MPSARESGALTLAAIRKGKGETQCLFSEKQSILRVAAGGKAGRDTATREYVEVAFSESARFYRLLRANPKFEDILMELREAKEKQRPVRVLIESMESNIIEDVDAGG